MKENAKNFIYLNTKTYVSLQQLLCVAIAFVFVTFIVVFYGEMAQKRFLTFSAISVLFSYILFVIIIRCERVKKSFPLRFLVNGITAMFLSALFALVLFAIIIVIEPKLSETILPFSITYLLFLTLYCTAIIVGVHKDAFRKIRRFNRMPLMNTLASLSSLVIPYSVAGGKMLAIYQQATLSDQELAIKIFTGFIILIFLCVPGFSHFIRYYYCIKYDITCDENGDGTSPKLIPRKTNMQMGKKSKAEDYNDLASPTKGKKEKPKGVKQQILKVIRIAIAIPIAVFVLLFFIGVIVDFWK